MKTSDFWVSLVSSVLMAMSIPNPASPQVSLPGPVIENIRGVRIVHNGKGETWGRDGRIALNLVLRFGDIDTENEQLAFHYPSDIAVDKSGNIYVLDSGNARIQKFSPEGKYLSTFGRNGQGPGEFMMPDGVDIDKEDGLVVSDGTQSRIQIFPKSGKDINSIALRSQSIHGIRALSNGNYVSSTSSMFGTEAGRYGKTPGEARLLKVLTPRGKILNEFGIGTDFGEPLTNQLGNACVFDVDDKDAIYLGFIYQNRIEKFSPDGKLLWRADRPLGYSTEVKRKGWIDPSSSTGLMVSPEMNACSTSIAADAKGQVWVVTYSRQLEKDVEEIKTGSISVKTKAAGGIVSRSILQSGNTDLRSTEAFKLEIFSPLGELMGEIPLTHFADVIRIHEDNIFMIDRDHGCTVYIYKIVDK